MLKIGQIFFGAALIDKKTDAAGEGFGDGSRHPQTQAPLPAFDELDRCAPHARLDGQHLLAPLFQLPLIGRLRDEPDVKVAEIDRLQFLRPLRLLDRLRLTGLQSGGTDFTRSR